MDPPDALDSDGKLDALVDIAPKTDLNGRSAGGRNGGSDKKGDGSEHDLSAIAKNIASRVLQFLSEANNETLGACFVGLGAATYLVLGRFGLILIGVVGGVILHAVWENTTSEQGDEESKILEARKRREKSLDIIARLLNVRERGGAEVRERVGDARLGTDNRKELDFREFNKETKHALEEFTDAVVRDYVKWWYSPLLPVDVSFPTACRQMLIRFLLTISNQISRKRPADTFLDFVTNSSSILIVFLSELANALRSGLGSDPLEAIEQYTEENPSCSLANVLDQAQQEKKLKSIAEDILQNFLDVRSYSCEPVRIFLREVLASLILEMTIESCSKPYFLNEWIIYALEDGETTQLVQAIDAGVSGATTNGSSIPAAAAEVEKAIKSGENMESLNNGSHKRTRSRAEEAMEEAMREARRLTELIAEEEAKNSKEPEVDDSNHVVDPRQMFSDSLQLESPIQDSPLVFASEESLDLAAQSDQQQDEESKPALTTFDQIVSSTPTALQSTVKDQDLNPPAPMSLHNATVSIFDDSAPGEKSSVKSKPTIEYLLQIEPSTSHYPGWMIPRKYSDFEALHEVLRRISVISGVTRFAEKHQTLPAWKNRTKAALRVDLERYLQDALSFQRLAESEGMKRFLEKDQGLNKASPGTQKAGFGFPSQGAIETMGKGMLDGLTSAPKVAAGGGKAIVGGVTGVFGGIGSIGQKKQSYGAPVDGSLKAGKGSTSSLPRTQTDQGLALESPRKSQDALGSFTDGDPSPPDPRSIEETQESTETPRLQTRSTSGASGPLVDKSVSNGIIPIYQEKAPNSRIEPPAEISEEVEQPLNLPPPPSEIADDYSTIKSSPKPSLDDAFSIRTSTSTNPSTQHAHPSPTASLALQSPKPVSSNMTSTNPANKPPPTPLTLPETTVAIELFFAAITELYTLSSAWSLRLTLLSAAKTFLLRQGNPNLDAIRNLLQSTLIDPYTSDTGIAGMIRKTRATALPTEEELKSFPALPEEGPEADRKKDERRKKARKLLTERGMPIALTGVMGQAASGEALGKVFDCLQGEKVARGLVFAIVLQAVRAVTQ